MSASVIGARNVAYWRPDRSLGVVHAAGGNMHHARYDPKTSLAGVPFLAINGEMEACGPEGGGHMSGAAGIRPEYGFQTQWVMIRDSLIERRIQDPSHFMNLLVLANAGHGSWSDETAYLCGLFILKAAQYRAPPGPPDPDAIRPCVALKPESGWLTDANLKAPQFAPAPYGKYEGDPGRAFWHFDEELARATVEYHTGVFTRPDPAWGPLDIEAVRAFNLARVQGGEAAYKALLPLCEATDDTRRADAAGYLSRLGPASLPAIPRLIEMFGERPVPKVGEAVARALARLAPDSTPPLLAAMKHADGFVRAGALTALCNIGQPADTIVAAAEAAAADPSPAVHRAALDTLIALRAPPARIGVTAAAVLDDLAAAGQPLAFTNTLVLAMQFGPASLAAVTPALIRALGNPDLSIFRTAAAGILAVRPKPPREAIPAFVAAVRTPDTNRWSIAVEAIGRLDGYGDTNLTVACIGHLQATNDAVADQAASILVRTAAKSGTPVFRARMAGFLAGIVDGNGSTALRRRAARAIGGFGADAKGAIPVLEMAAEEPGMRDAARAAIVDIRAGTGPSLDADGL
jgi:HEAT repeat protein